MGSISIMLSTLFFHLIQFFWKNNTLFFSFFSKCNISGEDCPVGQVKCPCRSVCSVRLCIPIAALCDNVRHCADGSDEEQCFRMQHVSISTCLAIFLYRILFYSYVSQTWLCAVQTGSVLSISTCTSVSATGPLPMCAAPSNNLLASCQSICQSLPCVRIPLQFPLSAALASGATAAYGFSRVTCVCPAGFLFDSARKSCQGT